MLFNTIAFALFYSVVFVAYWMMKDRLRGQNLLLLAASYFFYANWDWRFLFLLMFSTLLDYFTGIRIREAASVAWRKRWLAISVCTNLGFLAFFKYYNFFIGSFADALSMLGLHTNPWTLQVILPVGISFYTFHGLSYVLDIYYRRIEPERDFVDYSLFVSFFPLLVAGPIERATHLLPQIKRPRHFDGARAVDGLRQILWGLFKKVVIADNCAELANRIFNHYHDYSGSTLVFGALFFAIQIYADFSGYSDMALGTARLLGIELLRNFAFPYFSRDIAEFWRRWHISLSSWFRDYLYIPLGGSRGGNWHKIRNTFAIFLVSGFWHGANWTFLFWGFLNALYFLPVLLAKKNRVHLEIVAADRMLPNLKELWQMVSTFLLTLLAWVFFRSESIGAAFRYLRRIFSASLFARPEGIAFRGQHAPLVIAALIIFFFMVEWHGRRGQFALERLGLGWHPVARRMMYVAFAVGIFYFAGRKQEFIYFQF